MTRTHVENVRDYFLLLANISHVVKDKIAQVDNTGLHANAAASS